MNTYKITNITNLMHKRDAKYNSVVNIEYVDNRAKKIISVKAGQTIFLTIQSLPLTIHRLRIKEFITITEVSAAELAKSIEIDKPRKTPKAVSTKAPKKVIVEEKVPEITSFKSQTNKKKTTETKPQK